MAVKAKKKKRIKVPYVFEKVGPKLNIKQEAFCQYYTRNDAVFGNATQAYAEAYGYRLENLSDEEPTEEVWDEIMEIMKTVKLDDSPYAKAYNTCSVMGHRLLRNTKINERVKEILREMMVEAEVDSEIMYVIKQKTDFGAKMSAIKEFNKLKGRIIEKVEVTETKVDPVTEEKSRSLIKKYLNGRNRIVST